MLTFGLYDSQELLEMFVWHKLETILQATIEI